MTAATLAIEPALWQLVRPLWSSPEPMAPSDEPGDPSRPAASWQSEVASLGRLSREQVLEKLYVRSEGRLTNVLYRWLWDREEVADVVQEAFLRLWRMGDRVEWERAEALVFKIALNLAASRRRWRSIRHFVSLEGAGPAAPDDAHAQLTDAERAAAVRSAIDALPEKYRRVLTLAAFSGLGHDEIAAILGIAPGTVASRRNTALRKVRKKLMRWEAGP